MAIYRIYKYSMMVLEISRYSDGTIHVRGTNKDAQQKQP